MRKVLSAIFGVGAFISFTLLLGAAGAIDTDSIGFNTGSKYLVILTIVFVVCTILAQALSNKEEEE